MKRITAFIIILSLAGVVFGQYRESSTPSLQSRFTQPQSGLFSGLLNGENLNMSHTISMGYASSSYGSAMTGMYLNSMRYRLSPRAMLNLNLGFLTQPYSSFDDNPGGTDNTQFIGGAELVYRPSRNIIFSVGVNNMPYYYYDRSYPSHLYGYPFGAFNYPYYQTTPADVTGNLEP